MNRKWKAILAAAALLSVLAGFFWIRGAVRHRRWVSGHIENHPVRVYDVQYPRVFNDLNDLQLQVAETVGVPPVQSREEASRMKNARDDNTRKFLIVQARSRKQIKKLIMITKQGRIIDISALI